VKEQRETVLTLLDEAQQAGASLKACCDFLGLSVRTVQRWRKDPGGSDNRKGPHSAPANKLSKEEEDQLLATVNAPEFRDLSPKQIVPMLADQGDYIASESTIYRVLRRRGQLTHRHASRPARHHRPKAHTATGPNQVYTWDITYLKSPVKGCFYYLYMFIDIYSRKVVGWSVEEAESSKVGARLLREICEREGVEDDQVVLHADNGAAMKGATFLATMQALGIVPSFSRPRVSDDNPFSESLFRTVKYRPDFPRKPFESLEKATAWVTRFVHWYNHEHLHSALRFVTPHSRHTGKDKAILQRRHLVYQAARRARPDRWSRHTRNWTPVGPVTLNGRRASDQRRSG